MLKRDDLKRMLCESAAAQEGRKNTQPPIEPSRNVIFGRVLGLVVIKV